MRSYRMGQTSREETYEKFVALLRVIRRDMPQKLVKPSAVISAEKELQEAILAYRTGTILREEVDDRHMALIRVAYEFKITAGLEAALYYQDVLRMWPDYESEKIRKDSSPSLRGVQQKDGLCAHCA